MRLTDEEVNALSTSLGMFVTHIKNDGPTKRLYAGLLRKVQAEQARRRSNRFTTWLARIFIFVGAVTIALFAVKFAGLALR